MEEISLRDMSILVEGYRANGRDFRLEEKRGNKYLYDGEGHLRFIGLKDYGKDLPFKFGLPKEVLFSFVAGVRMEINRYLKDNNGVVEPFGYPTNGTDKNEKRWKLVKDGDFFWETDMEHAYFQALHKLGYISDKYYLRYCNLEDYKRAYIYSVSWGKATKNVIEFKKGIKNSDYNVTNDEYGIIYDNVRGFLSHAIDEAVIVSGGGFLRSTVDSIMYLPENKDAVLEYFRGRDLKVKHTLCRKLDGKYMFRNGKKVNF